MLEFLKHPWPWWVAGPLIGLMVPALLLLGNKTLGISSTLRHICAAVFPANISYFKYDWKKESWNLVFVCGILLGSWFAAQGIGNPDPIVVAPNLSEDLNRLGIHPATALAPAEIFSWSQLFTARSFLMVVGGGFLVGFGTRYAGGCTSGHSIMGLANLQWPSLVATICFMTGGFIMANFILPYILTL
jgi:uncharacterized membrane protein YedE/YeeE